MGAEMPKVKEGDRVRVTYEAEVYYRSPNTLFLKGTEGSRHAFDVDLLPDNFKMEVLEPAVEEFQPGDIVTEKGIPSYRYLVLPGGQYVNEHLVAIHSTQRDGLTTKGFVKVGHINELLRS